MSKCRDDLTAITRYVSWNLNERGSGALCRALPDQTDIVTVYRVAVEASQKGATKDQKTKRGQGTDDKSEAKEVSKQEPLAPIATGPRTVDRDYRNLMQLMEEAVMSRDANRTNMVVGGLVQHIVAGWRLQFCGSVVTKFNCYFMLPFVDEFHRFIRKELQKLYDGDEDGLAEVFDLAAARRSLKKTRDDLYNECMANKRLQDKFRLCSQMLNKP
jgi:hypothetical protein